MNEIGIINDAQLPITRTETKGPAVDTHASRKEKGQPEPHWMDGGQIPTVDFDKIIRTNGPFVVDI